MKNPKYPI